VVLIVIDCLRADHLPVYGYEKNTAPFLSRLAEEGVVFENTFSTSSWTAPATASIFTSLYPFQHGVTMGLVALKKTIEKNPKIKMNRIPAEVNTAPEYMKKAGYRTFAVTGNLNICSEEGFDQGFDKFQCYTYGDAELLEKKVLEWEDEIKAQTPYFLYLHYMDPHKPLVSRAPWYEKMDDHRKNEISKYDSEINYADMNIGELFERFNWDQNTIVIITADHGEGLWDHGKYGHGHDLYDETIRVPLIFYCPELIPKQKRITSNTSVLDILPTMIDLAGLQKPTDLEGVSLASLIKTEDQKNNDRIIFSHIHRIDNQPDDLIAQSAVYRDWKYYAVSTGVVQLFNLKDDLDEQINLVEKNVNIANQLKTRYINFRKSCKKFAKEYGGLDVDKELLKEIEAMGYAK